MKLATFNLYHFAEPDMWWYRRDPDGRARFTPEEWTAKTAWIAQTLRAIDADVVGFQEVVAVEALRALTAAAGYPYFATVATPRVVEEGGERVYVRPVQAIASRAPMTVDAPTPHPGLAASIGWAETAERPWGFRRPPVRARLTDPDLGPVVVYCCHLKSPGVSVSDAPLASAPGGDQAALSRAHAFATMQRVTEASALFHDAATLLSQPEPPVVAVMGDVNDAPESPTWRALSPHRPFERDGAALSEGAATGVDGGGLVDAYRLAPRDMAGDMRPVTHRHGASGSTIDIIFVPADGPARVAEHVVWDAHFLSGDPRTTSDHAPVSITLAPTRR